MAVHPYPEDYVGEVMSDMGDIFDLALRQENIPADQFIRTFIDSKVAKSLDSGALMYLNGCSAQESLGIIQGRNVEQTAPTEYGAEYWSGYILAYLHWKVNRPLRFIIERIPFADILSMYHLYHEMRDEAAVQALEKRLDIVQPLLSRRLQLGFTQQELADCSRVNVRNIRAYEQGQNDISKASGETLFNLSRALGCSIEYLLVGPRDQSCAQYYNM